MLFAKERHKEIIYGILSKHPYDFYVFGSRAKGTQKELSDLDLCFLDPIPSSILNKIEEEFEESDLPYKTDILNWNTLSKEFQDAIEDDLFCLK